MRRPRRSSCNPDAVDDPPTIKISIKVAHLAVYVSLLISRIINQGPMFWLQYYMYMFRAYKLSFQGQLNDAN